jgi:hypothetical protein
MKSHHRAHVEMQNFICSYITCFALPCLPLAQQLKGQFLAQFRGPEAPAQLLQGLYPIS